MSYVVSIFDKEADLDDALNELYDTSFRDNRVVLMRNTGDFGDNEIARSDVLDKPAPLFAYAYPSSDRTAGVGVASVSEIFAGNLKVSEEVMDFYREQADDGAVIVFVETKSDEANNVRTIMNKHHPSRIDQIES